MLSEKDGKKVPQTSNDPARRFQVVITDYVGAALDVERVALSDIADVVFLDAAAEEDLVGRIEQADAVMTYHTLSISRKTIERLARCRLIVRCGVGFDNVDYEFARQRGIPVANVPDYGTEEVADSAIGLMLALTRGLALLNSRLRAGDLPWSHELAAPLQRLRGQRLGIVGLGRIGTATALRAKAFGMDVLFFDPYKPDGYDKALGVRRMESLEELLSSVFVLSLHCPLTPETLRMIDANRIARMPQGSYLINTARGAVLDTRAIPDAVASGQLAGAAIDVLEFEPPHAGDPLIRAWRDPHHRAHHRVIINSHTAFYSEQGLLDLRRKGAKACRRALLGLPLRNVINGL